MTEADVVPLLAADPLMLVVTDPAPEPVTVRMTALLQVTVFDVVRVCVAAFVVAGGGAAVVFAGAVVARVVVFAGAAVVGAGSVAGAVVGSGDGVGVGAGPGVGPGGGCGALPDLIVTDAIEIL